MPTAQFEEKTYETLVGYELREIAKSVPFSPGQSLEFYLGFDQAFLLPQKALQLFGLLLGAGLSLSELEKFIRSHSSRLPKIKSNLFIQYKRPNYMCGAAAKEWSIWSSAYYRYDLMPHQQAALIALKHHSAGRAEVIYASPAFWQLSELYEYADKKRLIEKSNVVCVSKLNGHKRYSYNAPGGNGTAHSDPESVSTPPLRKLIEAALEKDGVELYQHVIETADLILLSIGDDAEGKRILEFTRKAMLSMFSADGSASIPQRTFLHSLATIQAYLDIFSLSLYALR